MARSSRQEVRIYTRTGDKGTTGLVGGARVSKASLRIGAIGDIDELNACIGVCRASSSESFLDAELEKVQNWLFEIGAELATPPGRKYDNATIGEAQIEWLEHSMDEFDAELEPLKNFILPGGCLLAANLHFARSVCRRAERTLTLLHNKEPLRSELIVCINRLSDWFFVTARVANRLSNVHDVKWDPQGK